jgi:hypothetical protein
MNEHKSNGLHEWMHDHTSHQNSFATNGPTISYELELTSVNNRFIGTNHACTPGPNLSFTPDTQVKLDWTSLIGQCVAVIEQFRGNLSGHILL